MSSIESQEKHDVEHVEDENDNNVCMVQIDAGKYLEVNHTSIAQQIDALDEELLASGKKPFLASRWLKKPDKFIWYLASLASVGGLLFGVDQSLISGASLYLPHDLNLDSSQQSMVVGFTPLGAMGGALTLMPLNDIFGRRGTIIISSIVFTVGAIMEAAAQGFAVMLVGRIVLGLALGMLSGTVPAYISENCARKWRGGLVSLYQVMVGFGVMMGYVIAAIFNSVKGNWRYVLGSSVVFSTVLFFGMLTLPESTRWLMKKGRKLDAYQVWKHARGLDSIDERQEFFIMENVVLYEKEKSQEKWLFLELFGTKRCLRAISVAVTCSLICQQMSGVNSIEYYQATLVQAAGLSPENAVYSSLVGGGVMFLSTIPAIYLMDRLGRRTLTLSLIPGIAIGLIITGCSFLADNLGVKLGLYFWGIITYNMFWAPGLGPVPYLLSAEVYPTYLRSYGMSLASFCNWTGTFITTYPFQYMADAMTSTGVFAGLYCGLLLLGALYLLFFMPETKGLTLEEVGEIFQRPLTDTMYTNIRNLRHTWNNLLHFRFKEFDSHHSSSGHVQAETDNPGSESITVGWGILAAEQLWTSNVTRTVDQEHTVTDHSLLGRTEEVGRTNRQQQWENSGLCQREVESSQLGSLVRTLVDQTSTNNTKHADDGDQNASESNFSAGNDTGEGDESPCNHGRRDVQQSGFNGGETKVLENNKTVTLDTTVWQDREHDRSEQQPVVGVEHQRESAAFRGVWQEEEHEETPHERDATVDNEDILPWSDLSGDVSETERQERTNNGSHVVTGKPNTSSGRLLLRGPPHTGDQHKRRTDSTLEESQEESGGDQTTVRGAGSGASKGNSPQAHGNRNELADWNKLQNSNIEQVTKHVTEVEHRGGPGVVLANQMEVFSQTKHRSLTQG
ncbi:hypothetical protein OGAPHI_006833 [Ogataea philodendri]|uniref:Major facilitator superfamily (MFS) profile domain-containing protein n=1 Tax=Ogataea philodendri TaxID=1378263 RepID=A0A9P8T0G6_9ASCO|nr:uncharacterized protein OGAPHI_006833 [Ogataea philodendri]KAH3661426.1 hypothetical protein OGAPHI_006833 [Ogataea philodendri]